MYQTWYGVYSWRLFDPREHPSYFNTMSGVHTGDPAEWEIATLLVFACCVVTLAVIIRRRLHRVGVFVALLLAPIVIGAAGTIIQVHQAFIGMGREWIGPAAPFEAFIYFATFSTHLGAYGTILLSVIFGPLYYTRIAARNI